MRSGMVRTPINAYVMRLATNPHRLAQPQCIPGRGEPAYPLWTGAGLVREARVRAAYRFGGQLNSHVTTAGPTEPAPDARVARAMDQVLEAERAAQASIAECERICEATVERARQQGRAVIEHAQARIVALHARAAKGLESRAAEITLQRRKSAAEAIKHLSHPGRRADALERMAAHLTAATVAQPRDGN